MRLCQHPKLPEARGTVGRMQRTVRRWLPRILLSLSGRRRLRVPLRPRSRMCTHLRCCTADAADQRRTLVRPHTQVQSKGSHLRPDNAHNLLKAFDGRRTCSIHFSSLCRALLCSPPVAQLVRSGRVNLQLNLLPNWQGEFTICVERWSVRATKIFKPRLTWENRRLFGRWGDELAQTVSENRV